MIITKWENKVEK